MAAPLQAPLPQGYDLITNYQVVFTALDATTGDLVTGVLVSNAAIGRSACGGSATPREVLRCEPAALTARPVTISTAPAATTAPTRTAVRAAWRR